MAAGNDSSAFALRDIKVSITDDAPQQAQQSLSSGSSGSSSTLGDTYDFLSDDEDETGPLGPAAPDELTDGSINVENSTAVVHRFHSSISSLADDEKSSRLSRYPALTPNGSSSTDPSMMGNAAETIPVHQHQLFAHACVQLLDERDRQDFLRRKSIRQKMLNRGTSLVGEEGEDEGIGGRPLLTLIKSGTLFKLHKSIAARLAPKLASLQSFEKNEDSTVLRRSQSEGPTRLLNSWKPKFVEVRRGILSYWDDSPVSKRGFERKNIALHVSSCTCRAVASDKGSRKEQQFVFEVLVHGAPRRLFATGSEEARKGWMKAIDVGMVGGNSEFKAAKNDLSSPEFTKFSNWAKQASSLDEYTRSFAQKLWGSSLCVHDRESERNFSSCDVGIDNSPGPAQLFSDLQDYSFVLNEKPIQGVYVGERVFGSLLRLILAMDGQSVDVGHADEVRITDIQAARHARDCLKMITGNHRERIVSSCLQVINALCRNNDDLVSVESVPAGIPYHVEITVKSKKHTEAPPSLVRGSDQDRRAWIYSRTSSFKPAKRCYAILSLGAITYYREALPRPHHLIDQEFLGCGMSVGFFEREDESQEDDSMHSKFGYIIYIRSKSKTRQLCFLDKDMYNDWKHLVTVAVQSSTKKSPSRSMDDTEIDTRRHRYSGTSSDLVLVSADPVASHTTDENGIAWLALPHRRPSLEHNSMLGLSTRILQSATLIASDQLLPKPNISRLVSAANLMSLGLLPALSQRLPVGKGISNGFSDSDVLEETEVMTQHDSQPTVQVEIRLHTLARLRKKDDPNTVISTVRAISQLSMNLSSSSMYRTKLVKIDALKGAASLSTFRLFFDNEGKLSRRVTAP